MTNWCDIHSYALELEQIKGTISSETFKEPSQREDAKKVVYMTMCNFDYTQHYVTWYLHHSLCNVDDQEVVWGETQHWKEQVVLLQAQILSCFSLLTLTPSVRPLKK